MSSFHTHKETLLHAAEDLADLLQKAKTMPGLSKTIRDDWEKTCRHIRCQVSEDVVRVAVVGSIKSGKSTFINAFLKGDHLKRGAGVVTSIVTRVRKGDGLKATLYFKSWDEINADVAHAMVLLPNMTADSESTPFDIRDAACRTALQEALGGLNPENLVSNGVRNENCVLMTSYLKGFEAVRHIVSTETVVQRYEDDNFARHRDFVGDDALAVYLKDIELEINADSLEDNLEIADCQGSDSPNPLHLAMIQDYLLITHLIIYVVSSRTGLRRADIRFLSMIRKMGLSGQILFVLNSDFSEHDTLEGLQAIIERTREEISLIKPSPQIYTISSLFNLFTDLKSTLTEKDHMRLLQWQEERELTVFSDEESRRLMADFEAILSQERYTLLLLNPIERLNVVLNGVEHWVDLNLNILNRSSVSASEILGKIQNHQAKLLQLKNMMKSTLDGALSKIKQELRSDVDRFFDVRYGNILTSVINFVQQHVMDVEHYQNNSQVTHFTQTLYLVFQDFKHGIDTFLTESIMPEVIRFVREEECKLSETLRAIAVPYDDLLQDALTEYGASMSHLGFSPVQFRMDALRIPEIEIIKAKSSLKLPPSSVTLRYSVRIKTEAVVKFGCYTAMTFIKRLLKKTVDHRTEDQAHALKDGIRRMKLETEKSLLSHFRDYQENIKFQYLLKLADIAFQSLFDCLLDRFHAYAADISQIVEWADGHQNDRLQITKTLSGMRQQSRGISNRVQAVREQMTLW